MSQFPQSFKKSAHDIRTALATIKIGTKGLQEFLPQLLNGYTKAMAADLLTDKIQPRHLEMLNGVLLNIEKSAQAISEQLNQLQLELSSSHEN